MSRLMLLVCQVSVAVVGLALWQLLATVPVFGRILLPPFFFSNPVDVGSQIVDWFSTGGIWKHLMITLWESFFVSAMGPFAGSGSAFPAVARPRHLVEGGARRHAGVLHRVLQRLSGRQGGQHHRAGQWPHARHERTAVDAACLLAVGAVVDVLLAAYLG